MILLELFDTVAPYTTNQHGEQTFTINGKQYAVNIHQTNKPGVVEVSFHLEIKSRIGTVPSMAVLGTGDELAVFGTVLQVIRDYITNNNVREISFGSEMKEKSRVKLYDRMVNNLANGWNVCTETEGLLKVYILTNPNYKESQAPGHV